MGVDPGVFPGGGEWAQKVPCQLPGLHKERKVLCGQPDTSSSSVTGCQGTVLRSCSRKRGGWYPKGALEGREGSGGSGKSVVGVFNPENLFGPGGWVAQSTLLVHVFR